MNKINTILFSIALLITTFDISKAAISQDQEQFINSLSDEQIYDLYVNQLASAFTIQASSSINIPNNFNSKFNKCFKKHVKKVFSATEIRELYIQPENFNSKKASYNIKKLEPQYKSCIIEGMK